MSILEEHFRQLSDAFPSAKLDPRPDGSAVVQIQDFPVPSGWNAPKTAVLFVVPVGYPIAKPDTFWTDENLRLSTGGMPANASINANYGGAKPMLWFSFHPNSWNPQVDSLFTYAMLIRRRLSEPR